MKLSDVLRRDQLICDLAASTKEEAITELIDCMIASKVLPANLRSVALKSVMDREKALSTGMEHGIAIPHGSIDEVDDMVCALGISRTGVEFASLDGLPAQIIILIVIPRQRFSLHVRTLAGIARLLSHAGMRDRLKKAATPEEAIRIIHEEEKDETVGSP